jgi:hypothetical protein
MAATPCSMTQFRQYITTVFADQLQGTINDVRGDKSTARPRVLEDLPGWSSMQRKFDGEAIGMELPQAVELLGVRTRQSLSTSVTNQVVRKIRTTQRVNDLNPSTGAKHQKE